MSGLTYLASPYSSPDPEIRNLRFRLACHVVSRLMFQGWNVISPIVHNHPCALLAGLPTGWEFWQVYDRALLSCCERVLILTIDGWDTSEGIKAETQLAIEMQKPIAYVDEWGNVRDRA